MDNYINKYNISNNTELLKKLDKASIDMIYFDPPYNTGRDFSDYKDKYGKDEYITMITNVIKECYRILNKQGNIIIHVESRISHFIRNILDDVFGHKKYKNTIIWKTGGNAKNKYQLGRMHDVIIVYGKSGKNKTKFNSLYIPYDDAYRKKYFVKMCPIHKKEYVTTVAHYSQENVNPRPNLRYEWKGNTKQWYWTKERMEKLDADNRLQYNKKNIPRIKRFLNEMDGIPITDLWTDIPNIQAKEKLNYATQKPIQLLDRIIKLYSNENDLLLDPFAGSGTLGRSAIKNNRQYILIDENENGKKIFEKSISKID
jgi:DNA modification methylase